MTTVLVTHHEGETLEDDYRRTDGDEFGYEIPVVLLERLEEARRELDAANDAIRRYIADNDVPEIEVPEVQQP